MNTKRIILAWAFSILTSIVAVTQVTQQVTAIQYYYNTDPGVGISGNGAIIPVSPTNDLNQAFALVLPGSLNAGFHNLYVRAKDEYNRWSTSERRMFYISDAVNAIRNIVAYQYFFNTDPGIDIAGNGAIVPISPNTEYNTNIALTLPGSLTNGFHNLYIRVKNDQGVWSLAERRMFYISNAVNTNQNIVAYQYYFENDSGVGITGNGAIVPVSATTDYNNTIAITLPGSLSKGFHNFYIRVKNDLGVWSIAERKMFYINDDVVSQNILALEYYFDNDPGVGKANPYPIASTTDFNNTINIGVPCLSTGTHYFYLRAKNNLESWSIIEKDTLEITGGVAASDVSPSGPVTICSGNDIVLSTTTVPGVTYQWIESGNPIIGQTNASLTVTVAGNYALRSICGSSFTVSNTVSVSVQTQNIYYEDADNDGYGTMASSVQDCIQPIGYVINDDDCNDTNMNIYPGAPELCNLIDDDCDGEIDEGVLITFYEDADQDGFGTSTSTVQACVQPSGYVANDDDCNDANSNINPNAMEICNSIDDDCDGLIDEGVQITYYADADNDGFGTSASSVQACVQPSGYVTNADDCNDSNQNIHPNGTEICNGLDDNCDGLIDDNDPFVTGLFIWYADVDSDGYGTSASSVLACNQPVGYVDNDDDCDDGNMNVNPGATETCNDMDDDCDGLIDDNDPSITGQSNWYADSDNDTYGDPLAHIFSCIQPAGYVSNNEDCDDTNFAINPVAAEVCNTHDDDCDGMIDEGVLLTFYRDADNDGYGNATNTTLACNQPSGYVTNDADCNDVLYYVYPGAIEICNGIDDNCDGQIDEGFDPSAAASSITSSNGYNFCSGESTLLSVNGGTLGTTAEWIWYEGGCGNSLPIGSGNSIFVSPSPGDHNYYVRAEGTCNVTPCTFISITIYNSPTFNICPANIIIDNDLGLCSAFSNYSVIAAGNPIPTLTYAFFGATTDNGNGSGSGNTFNVGTTHIIVTAENNCGTSECAFDITVSDIEDPVIIDCPVNITSNIEPGQWGAHINWIEPTTTDNCEMDFITSNATSGDFFIVGATVVSYTAQDIYGNNSSCTFQVIVQPPQIIGDVNISIFANDIQFSNSNPAPGTFINVSATVHNNSNVAATNFVCHLLNQFSGETYSDVVIPGLGANQSTIINWNIQTPLVQAFVPMQISIDFLDNLNESNELDNQAIRPFINGDFSFGGRIVVIANAIPSNAIAGTEISICGSAHYTETAVLLTDSSVAGAQVTITIAETGQELSGVTNSNGNFCIPYHTPNTQGLYHFTAEVTDFTLTGDTSGTFLLNSPVIECPKDLSLLMELYGPFLCDKIHHIAQGASITGIVHVTNSCESITEPTTLFIALPDGSPMPGPFIVPPLATGQTYDVILPAMMFNIVGTTYISATTDFYDEVEEDNELNNTKSIAIYVHPLLPDIIPTGIGVSSSYQCIPSVINAIMDNQGGVASGSFNAILEVYHGSTLEASFSQSVNNIDALCQTTISFTINPLSDGQYFFNLYCDTGDDIVELSEVNNFYNLPHYYYSCQRDLIVFGDCEIDVKPSDPVTPGTISIHATIKNQGLLPVTTPFDVNFNVAGTIYPIHVTDPILANGTKAISISAATPPHGNNDLIIIADSNNDVIESDDANNSASDKLCWDFKVTNIRCDELPAMGGTHFICNPLELETRVFNLGLYEATNLQVQFEVNGPGLPPGWNSLGYATSFIDHSCPCPLAIELPATFLFPQTGSYQIRITADHNNLYTECDEGNNQIILDIAVVESADYALYSQFIAPSELNPDLNEAITLNVSYKNEGCSNTSSNELYVQVDNTPLDSLIAIPLASNGIHTYAIPQSWSSGLPGLHVIRSIIDHDNVIAENNELNNEATRSIIVGRAPNFRVTDLSASNLSPLPGETILLTATVTNEGDNSAVGMLQFYSANTQGEEILFEQHLISLSDQETIIKPASWFVTQPYSEIIARVCNVVPVEYDFTDNELSIHLNKLTVNIVVTDVTCNGIDLGTLAVNIVGGQAPYHIQWSNGYTDDIINVPAGMYSVEVTDANSVRVNALATVLNLAIPNTWYQDADGDNYGNLDIFELACIQPTGYVGTGTDCNDNNATVYPGAPEIFDQLDNDCDGMIDEGLSTLSIEAGDCNVVFFGYGPSECTTLSVNVQGGTLPYSYTWSNGATTATTEVCPIVTTIYNVTVTDHNGFTAQDAVTVQVVDVKCGNKKVNICHIPPGNPPNMHTICVSVNAIPAHLAHGCYLGVCDSRDPCEGSSNPFKSLNQINDSQRDIENLKEQQFTHHHTIQKFLYPNPTNQFVTVDLGYDDVSFQLKFFTSSGQLVKSIEKVKNMQTISTADLENGCYLVQIKSSVEIFTDYLVVIH